MTQDDSKLAKLICSLAVILSFSYILAFLVNFFPLNITNPAWYINLCNIIIDNAVYPLIGLSVLVIGGKLLPDDTNIKALSQLFANKSIIPAIGFLLIIFPLNFSVWGSVYSSYKQSAIKTREINRNYTGLKEAISQSSSIQEIQTRFKAFNGPIISNTDRALELSQAKKSLLYSLNLSRQRAIRSISKPGNRETIYLGLQTTKQSIIAILFSAAFSTAAQLPGKKKSLFDWAMDRRLPSRARKSREMSEYFDKITD